MEGHTTYGKQDQSDLIDNVAVTQAIKARLAIKINHPSYNVWILPIRFVRNGSRWLIYVPDEIYKNWLNEHYLDVLSEAFKHILGLKHTPKFTFVIAKPETFIKECVAE